ncbi:MAG TPA: hypothetical protein VHN12_13940, partial [Geobacteraceae bacterium]|nr:hypothetical protein [Geobacteraceae bacterium]
MVERGKINTLQGGLGGLGGRCFLFDLCPLFCYKSAMPRSARLDMPGLLQHVIVRGIEKRDIFLEDGDRELLIERLSALLKESEVRCYAWALMPNHFHLFLMPTCGTLA